MFLTCRHSGCQFLGGRSYSTSPKIQEPWRVELERGQKSGTKTLPNRRKQLGYSQAHLLEGDSLAHLLEGDPIDQMSIVYKISRAFYTYLQGRNLDFPNDRNDK